MNEEPKACPFCGSDDIGITVDDRYGTACICATCGSIGKFNDHPVRCQDDVAYEDWNTRPIEDALLARAEAAEARAKLVGATIARIEELENRVIELEAERRWIPVSQRNPLVNEPVIVRLSEIIGHVAVGAVYFN